MKSSSLVRIATALGLLASMSLVACAADTGSDDEGGTAGATTEDELRVRGQAEWFYSGPIPALESAKVTVSPADVERAYNDFWYDWGNRVVKTRRTSMVIDPPDGRIPPLTPAAQKAQKVRTEAYVRRATGAEDRILTERCLLFPTAGPPSSRT